MEYPVILSSTSGKWVSPESMLSDVRIPKNCALTVSQLAKLRDLVYRYDSNCPADDMRIFAKLVGLGFIIECRNGKGYFYHLNKSGYETLVNLVPSSPVRNSKRICGKCGGKGSISEYGHVAGGVCFSCNGKGMRK